MREFSDVIVNELRGKEDAGFHGSVVGTTVEDTSKEEGGEKGPAVVLVLGWESREKHMEGKELGGEYYPVRLGVGLLFFADNGGSEIPKKIGLIRVLRKEMDMWHVNLKEL